MSAIVSLVFAFVVGLLVDYTYGDTPTGIIAGLFGFVFMTIYLSLISYRRR